MKHLIYVIAYLLVAAEALALGTPAQTLERAKKEAKMELQYEETVPGKYVEVLPAPLKVSELPAPLKRLYDLERRNARYTDPQEFGDPIDMKVIGSYDPEKSEIVSVPYIPIPVDQFIEFLKADSMPAELKSTLFFKHKGTEYVRFFIHPAHTEKYEELIKKYGVVRTEFAGFVGASPRSFYVFDPSDKKITPFVVKTSLHFEIDGSVRINPPSKAARSALVTDIFASMSEKDKAEYSFDYLAEPLALIPKGKMSATIYRTLTPDMLDMNQKLISGFNLVAPNQAGNLPIKQMIKGQHFWLAATADALRPVMRLAAFLMFKEMLEGEMHEQNMYLVLSSSGKIKKVIIKDLDGFRVDVEGRVREGKSVAGLRRIFKPFIYSKSSQASGWTGDPTFHQNAYYSYIKRTFGYSISQAYALDKQQTNELYLEFDRVMAEEVQKITGQNLNAATLSVNLEENFEGLKELAQRLRANRNEGVSYSRLTDAQKDKGVQSALRREFLRLRKINRGSALLGNLDSDGVYFILHEDVIEARSIDSKTKHEAAIGFVALQPEDTDGTKGFKARLKATGLSKKAVAGMCRASF